MDILHDDCGGGYPTEPGISDGETLRLDQLVVYGFWKRLFDVAAAGVLLVLASPVMAAVAILLWLAQRKVLFTQLRPGLQGRPFTLYKFCSMREARDEYGVLLPDHERLTRIGSLVRSMSIDELPQLWNVLKGDMSFVGPRPLLMEYLGRYSSEQARRHEVKPGITGWAQVNGRNEISWTKKFEYDIWYVDHAGCLLDLKILTMTAIRVLTRSGISNQGNATMPAFLGRDAEPR